MNRGFAEGCFPKAFAGQKAFVFSYDALLFLAAVSFLALQMPYIPTDGKEHFLILQKQHDLVRVWLMDKGLEKGTIEKDFNFVFSGRNGTLVLGDEKIIFGNKKPGDKSSSAIECLYIKGLEIRKLTFSVFY